MTATTARPARVAIDKYLQRLAYLGDLRPSYATLEALHLAHATHIPFENIDVLLGRPVDLALEALQRKLVDSRRGGYCFEQNLLFAAVLEDLGFSVTPLAARVRYHSTAVLARTHMLLLVEADGARWVADVGFGSEGLLHPVPFRAGAEARQYLWSYRIVEEAGRWVLQSGRQGQWRDMYVFTLEPQERADYEMANYWIATHPASRFVQTLTVQMPTPEARWLLRNRELTVDRGGELITRPLQDDAELLDVLASTFGLRFPPDTTFPIPR